MKVGSVEITVAIDAVEVEVRLRNRADQILSAHQLVVQLAVRPLPQQGGSGSMWPSGVATRPTSPVTHAVYQNARDFDVQSRLIGLKPAGAAGFTSADVIASTMDGSLK